MKHLFLIFLLIAFKNLCYSQISLERQSISSTGSLENTGPIFAHSIVGTPIISTFVQTSIIVTQGFEQPVSDSTRIDIFTGVSKEGIQENYFKIFPNPAESQLNIRCIISKDMDFTIYDCFGRKVYTDIYSANQIQKTVNISDFPKGLYFIKIGTFTEQVVIR